MNTDIISLIETTPNSWQAKYRGNYGIYKIKMHLSSGKPTNFSCSCPSDYHPCKHIPIIEAAIKERMSESQSTEKKESISVKDVLEKVSPQELKNFIIRHAQYNPDFANTIQLQFLHKLANTKETSYATILRKALKKVHFDYDDLYEYHESSISIDILDEWLTKANDYNLNHNPNEAMAIAKAIIEEYAEWREDMDDNIIDYMDPAYEEEPFNIINQALPSGSIDADQLFNYCYTELSKPKYKETSIEQGFHNMLSQLAHTPEQGNQFLALQDECLKKTDKTSYEAERIIDRKITFYQKNNQADKAWELITENIQIESFRKKVVERKITEKDFSTAKKLIADFLSLHKNDHFYYHSNWNMLLLNIAQQEKDIASIRKLSFAFIENNFQVEYYRIYKSSFTTEEWSQQLQKIISHYNKNEKYFSDAVAEIFVEEKDWASLLAYIEKHLSAERIERYHKHFVAAYPQETLNLFQKALNAYAENHTGRSHYEYIVALFKQMQRIAGGKELIKMMVTQYKAQYKNRRAMIEVLNKMQ